MLLLHDMSVFNLVVAIAMTLITTAALGLTLRNALRQRRWRRRAADIVTTGILSIYWFSIVIARSIFGYIGPSPAVTLVGTFVFIVVGVHFLGIAIAQRDQFK